MRFRDVLNNTTHAGRLEVLLDEARLDWLRDLGKNDIQHSRAIEKILDRLVPDSIKNDEQFFDHGEVYLLLAAVYLHDIGRKKDVYHHEIESYNMLTKDPRRFFLRDRFEAEAVGQICASHSAESVWPIQKTDANYGIAGLTSSGRTLNLRRMGALLRLADELENTYERVKGITGQEESVRHLIRDVNPVPSKGVIEIHAEPRTWEEWETLKAVTRYTEYRLREVSQVIEELGLSYYQIWLHPGEFSAPLRTPGPTSTYHELVEAVGVLVEPRFDEVELLATVEGCEVSLLCTSAPLRLRSSTVILVAPTLTRSLVLEFAGALTGLKRKDVIEHGIVVTETPPDVAVDVLEDRGFPVYSLNALVTQLYDFGPAMRVLEREFRELPTFVRDLYVRPSGFTEVTKTIEDAETHILEWVSDPAAVHLTVLGDYGSGKTTLVERVAWELAMAHVENPELARVPILVRLKDVGTMRSIEAAITDVLVNRMGLDLNYRAFDALNHAGKFVVILDGFDELSGLHSESDVLRTFQELDKLASPQSKVLLTCRTHFFKDLQQLRRAHEGSTLYQSIDGKFGYGLLMLSPFTEPQIFEYLKRWDAKNAQAYFDLIQSIYNLQDLARRPVLLNMLAKTVPQLSSLDTSAHRDVNAATLYELYVRFWLARDDWRSPLSVSDRRGIAEAIAEDFFLRNRKSIHYSELPELLSRWRQGDGGLSKDVLEYECRTCNFLVSDGEGNFSFAHRSFMEYILATVYSRCLWDDRSDIGLSWFVPFEREEADSLQTANPEIQDFVLQQASLRFRTLTPEAIFERVNGRARAERALARIARELGMYSLGLVWADLLRKDRKVVGRDELALLLMTSHDLPTAIEHLASCVQDLQDLPHFEGVYAALLAHSEVAQVEHLAVLERRLNAVEDKAKPKTADRAEGDTYPFTRLQRSVELSSVLNDITDEAKVLEARRRFERDWARRKAEYDQAERRRARKVAETEEATAQGALKKRGKER